MSAVLRRQWWQNGRLHRVWFDADTGKVTHERLIPPDHIAEQARKLEDLKFSAKERARKAQGLHQIATFTTNEREEMWKQGIKGGDTDGIKWALKQDRWRHAKVGS